MAANLPELYKNNVGPVGDRREKERDVLYTALMPLKWEIYKKKKKEQTYLNHACTTGVHIVLNRSVSTNWLTRLVPQNNKWWFKERTPTSETAEQTSLPENKYDFPSTAYGKHQDWFYCERVLILSNITLFVNSEFSMTWTSRCQTYGCFQKEKRKTGTTFSSGVYSSLSF